MSDQILRCAFCAAEYPPGTPPTQHELLTAHVKVCPEHPMRELEGALREVLKFCSCRGTGVRTRDCTLCGDSTFDHACNDEEVPCSRGACIEARRILASYGG